MKTQSGPTFRKNPRRLVAAALLLSAALAACASTPVATYAPEGGWSSPLRQEHPLVGRVWESATGRFIAPAALLDALANTRYTLLGEKHDNPDHHALQHYVIAELGAASALQGVALEMLTAASAPRAKTLGSRTFDTPDELAAYLEWDRVGWDWSLYAPLVWSAYEQGIPLSAANLSRPQMSLLYAQPEPVAEDVIDAAGRATLRADIDASHCGMLPASQFDAMVRVQQGRDQAMAESLSGLPGPRSTRVLIAGNYHIRQDIGVPNYLLAREADLQRTEIASVALLEVAPDEFDPQAYLAESERRSYDYVWFTPALSNKDYCAGMRGEEEDA